MKIVPVLTVAAILGTAPLAASACEKVHALQFDIEGGAFQVFVNDVYMLGRGPGSGTWPLMAADFVKPGENEVTVELLDDGATADIAMMTGCMGGFELEGPFDKATLAGKDSATLRFNREEPVEASHLNGTADGPDGLIEAVESLQAAVQAGDIDATLALHAPMLADAARMGMPAEQMQAMLGYFFSQGEKIMHDDLQIEEAMDGRVFLVMTADHQPPVEVLVEDGTSKAQWRSGVYWARIDGKWGVLTLLQ